MGPLLNPISSEMAELGDTADELPTLSDNNYKIWSSCTKSYLEGKDLWEIFSSKDAAPPANEEALKKWKVKAAKVMYILKTTVEDKFLKHIEDAKTPQEAWDAISFFFVMEQIWRRDRGPEARGEVYSWQETLECLPGPILNQISSEMAALAGTANGLPKLKGNNYKFWSICTKSYLEGQDLWEIVDSKGTESRANVDEFEKWIVKAAKAIYILKITVEDKFWEEIEKYEMTPRTIWDNIAFLHSWKYMYRVAEDGRWKVLEGLPGETRNRRLKLYRAAVNGDWEMAKGIFEVYKDDIRVAISKTGDTALHIATSAKHIDFVKELLKIMNEGDLGQTNDQGETAIFLAAASGMVELAKVMMKKNKAIVKVTNDNLMLPIDLAASLGHNDMVDCLYQESKDVLDGANRIQLLITLIKTELYDFALELLRDHPELATARDRNNETALHALSRKHLTSSNFGNQEQGCFRRCLNFVSGAQDAENKKFQALELVQSLWEKVMLSDMEISKLITYPWELIFEAAKQGNVGLLSILIREYPDLIWKLDVNGHSIFHIAVLYRQEDIFKLIYEIGSTKDRIVMITDKKGNNILHLAGMLPPSDRLNVVPGAALQMQLELLWYKEVRKVVRPWFVDTKNDEGSTPGDLFAKEHEGLRGKGEKWLKDTATSCMVVATLIATVVFAAAFAVPGGNKENTGRPFFLQKPSLKIFAISDAISLTCSCTSLLQFLSIFTSRHAQEDFLKKSPRKLHIGLITLSISVATMMVIFVTTFFMVFNNGSLWIPIPVAVIASVPVVLFIWQHLQLFRSIMRSTYMSEFLFQPNKTRLFYKEREASERQEAVLWSTNV